MARTYRAADAAPADSMRGSGFLKEADAPARFPYPLTRSMKARQTIILFVAVSLATGRLAAHTAQGNNPHLPPHEHPEFVSVTTEFKFHDGTEVSWSAVPAVADTFDVTVTQVVVPGTTKIFSLLTLGIQSIRAQNEVTPTAGADVRIYDHGNATGTPWTGPLQVARTGLNSSNTDLDKDKIMFVSFTGRTCKFRVKATRGPKFGETKWDGHPSSKSGHDNTPPDGYPEK